MWLYDFIYNNWFSYEVYFDEAIHRWIVRNVLVSQGNLYNVVAGRVLNSGCRTRRN